VEPAGAPAPAGAGGLWRPAPVVLLLIPVSLLGAGTSTAGRIAVVVTVAALTLAVAALVVRRVLPLRRSQAWIALLAGLLLVSFAFPQVRAATAPGRLFDLAGLLVGLALLGITVASAPRPRQAARVIALSGMVAAGYVLVRGGFDNGRLEGLGSNPNYLGFLLVLPLVAAAGLIRRTRNPRWLVPAAVCFLALSATHSRGAFLAAGVGVAVVVVQDRSRRFHAVLASATVIAGTVAWAAGMLHPLGRHIARLGAGDRTAVDLSMSNGLRMRVAKFAVRVIVEHPLRGIGYSMFPTRASRSPEFGMYLATHDEYLRLSAEAGIPALIVFVALLWLGAGRRRSGDLAILRAIVLTYVLILFSANPLANLTVSVPFWVALGCLLAVPPSGRALGGLDGHRA
jgi:hypothetical protein